MDPVVASECRNFLVDIYLKSQVDEKYKRVFVENFVKKVEEVSQQLNQIEDKNQKYVTMRQNWVQVIRTYLYRFDYLHIPIEDLKRYDPRTNIEVTVQLDPDNIKHKIMVNP